MNRVLITGAGGQLGWELQQCSPDTVEVFTFTSKELDIRNKDAVLSAAIEVKPHIIINAAAYTAVDKAENDTETAFAVNADGAAHLAMAAVETGARMIQVSTDYVFNGEHASPYLPTDAVSPLGVYGESKYQGEVRVQELLPNASVILRTSWVYSSHGHNFVKTMLRLMAERDELGVVADQIGSPTYARTLAPAIWAFCEQPQVHGVFHWTDAGVASWYDFAQAIMEEALANGLITKPVRLKPIRTEDYPTPAKRPPFSVLDKTSTWSQLLCEPFHWREALRQMLGELRNLQ